MTSAADDRPPVHPERWARLKDIFGDALELPATERSEYLDRACAGDAELRAEVDSLLAADAADDGGLLDTPAARLVTPPAEERSILQAGKQIARYRTLSLIGTGGMGEVYLAKDTRLGRRIALKVLPPELSRDAARLRRFDQEARAASALSHPNVCVIYEVGEGEDGRHFIAMEFVPGETLASRLARHRREGTRMPLTEVLDVGAQIAAGLAAAHDVGIVHRDAKPDNVIIRPDGLVKILDFGLAKLAESFAWTTSRPSLGVHTDPGMVLGTVHYMSPEQARGLAVDARTDVFSLGVVLYEMLAGHQAFEGETLSDVMVAVLEREPRPLVGLCPEVPMELRHVVERALQKKRDARWQSMREMALALQKLRQELAWEAESGRRGFTTLETPNDALAAQPLTPPSTTPPAPHVPGPTEQRSRRWRYTVVCAILTAVAVIGWLIWSLVRT